MVHKKIVHKKTKQRHKIKSKTRKNRQKGGKYRTETIRTMWYHPHFSDELDSEIRVISGPEPINGFFDLEGISKMASNYTKQVDQDLETMKTGRMTRPNQKNRERVYKYIYGHKGVMTSNNSKLPPTKMPLSNSQKNKKI